MIITSLEQMEKVNGRIKSEKIDFELNTGEIGTFIIADIGASGRHILNESFTKMIDLNGIDFDEAKKGNIKPKFKENASLSQDNVLIVSLGVVDENDNRIFDSEAGRKYIGDKIKSSEVEKIALAILKLSGMDKSIDKENIEEIKKN